MFDLLRFGLCISEIEGHFLSGFLEGECHLGIVENNGGQSMACGLRVNVREDDQVLLEWLLAATGVGRLSRVPARATSKPQVAWTVTRHSECLEIVAFLRRFPFFGRKRRALALWSLAVEIHGATGSASELGALKQLIESQRAFGPPVALVERPRSEAALKGYITGFIAAEGHFGIDSERPLMSVHLRADDRPLLEMLAAETGCGRVYGCRAPPHLNPSATWLVVRQSHTQKLAEWLVQADLYGRKRAELDAWIAAVEETRKARAAGRKRDSSVMDAARERLMSARAYSPGPAGDLLGLNARNRSAEGKALLRRWADECSGPLASTAYMRWRNRDAGLPTRNTIVAWFGTWHAALAAAGLEERAAVPPSVVAARRAGARVASRKRREAQRARVVDAVARCRDSLGALPGPTAYMRWRLRCAPDAPAHGTIYRLFPGGWDRVLAVLPEPDQAAA